MNILKRNLFILKKTSRFIINMLVNAFQSYIVNLLHPTDIHNDLGASSTSLKRFRTRIIKKALTPDAEKKLVNEINWILENSNGPAKEYMPSIRKYSLEPGNVFYTMRYYHLPNFRRIIMNNMSTNFFLEKRVSHLLNIQKDLFYISGTGVKPSESYFEINFSGKLHDRLEKGGQIEPRVKPLIDAQRLEINGKKMIGCRKLFEAIHSSPDIVASLIPGELFVSHGDLHSNNILCGIPVKQVKLLDCRGKNTDGSKYFDPAYDIGKLYHDFHGLYSLIENHEFTITTDGKSTIDYSFNRHRSIPIFTRLNIYTRKQVENSYNDYGDVNYRADFIEAMLYLTMIVFHFSDFNEGLMCFTRGVEYLNAWVEKYHPELYSSLL